MHREGLKSPPKKGPAPPPPLEELVESNLSLGNGAPEAPVLLRGGNGVVRHGVTLTVYVRTGNNAIL